jgi:hypothetical protein
MSNATFKKKWAKWVETYQYSPMSFIELVEDFCVVNAKNKEEYNKMFNRLMNGLEVEA